MIYQKNKKIYLLLTAVHSNILLEKNPIPNINHKTTIVDFTEENLIITFIQNRLGTSLDKVETTVTNRRYQQVF